MPLRKELVTYIFYISSMLSVQCKFMLPRLQKLLSRVLFLLPLFVIAYRSQPSFADRSSSGARMLLDARPFV